MRPEIDRGRHCPAPALAKGGESFGQGFPSWKACGVWDCMRVHMSVGLDVPKNCAATPSSVVSGGVLAGQRAVHRCVCVCARVVGVGGTLRICSMRGATPLMRWLSSTKELEVVRCHVAATCVVERVMQAWRSCGRPRLNLDCGLTSVCARRCMAVMES